MYSIYIITALIILLYFAYPLWLKLISSKATNIRTAKPEIDGVSLILLSFNGAPHLEEKVRSLLQELRSFPIHEMIIVDDCSSDGSQGILEQFREEKDVRIILKEIHRGIPHTMNLAVTLTRYDHLVFCDQRQATGETILKKLLEPLAREEIGAVSACISHVDKAGCSSILRRYENFLKSQESRAGSLMGVYGPLYAMKKSCYVPIPDSIILDDLFLSLNVMATKKIQIQQACEIYDEHICALHDYRRIRRYLRGFGQILANRDILCRLPGRQLIMLFWHKYLRLLIPIMLFLCYLTTGIQSCLHPLYLIPFILLTVVGTASLTPLFFRIKNMMFQFARINILYVLAMGDLLLRIHLGPLHFLKETN